MARIVQAEFNNKLLLVSALDCLTGNKLEHLADLLRVHPKTVKMWINGQNVFREGTRRQMIASVLNLPGKRVVIKDRMGRDAYLLDGKMYARYEDDHVYAWSIEKTQVPEPVMRAIPVCPKHNADVIKELLTWRAA